MAKPATVQIVSIPAPKLQVFLRLFLTGNFLAFLILLFVLWYNENRLKKVLILTSSRANEF